MLDWRAKNQIRLVFLTSKIVKTLVVGTVTQVSTDVYQRINQVSTDLHQRINQVSLWLPVWPYCHPPPALNFAEMLKKKISAHCCIQHHHAHNITMHTSYLFVTHLLIPNISTDWEIARSSATKKREDTKIQNKHGPVFRSLQSSPGVPRMDKTEGWRLGNKNFTRSPGPWPVLTGQGNK